MKWERSQKKNKEKEGGQRCRGEKQKGKNRKEKKGGGWGEKKKREKEKIKERRGDGDGGERNRMEAILALAEIGRSLDSPPKDLAAAIRAGRIPGEIVSRYFELEKSGVFRWLLQFGGFKERLLTDDLFFTKVAIQCGVGIFTKDCVF